LSLATTVNVYATPFVSPGTILLTVPQPPLKVSVAPPGDTVTTYELTPQHGCIHDTRARALSGVATTLVGAGGGGCGVLDTRAGGLAPNAFVATTSNRYSVPFVRPVTVPLVCVPGTVVEKPGVEMVYDVIGLPPSLNGVLQLSVTC
jgi:hypothetical protein